MNYKLPLLALISITSVNAQGLYNTSGDSAYSDESMFQITAGARVGYDDNVTPIGSGTDGKEGSAYIGANVRAAYSETRSNAYLGFIADLGGIYYLDNDSLEDEITPVINLGLNLGYSVNERIRLSSNNYFTYGLEPDYERGIANDRRSDEYFAYSSYNTIGISWTNRFATKHSVNFSGADYGNGADFFETGFRDELRYKLSDRTVLKAAHTYSFRDNSDTQRYSAGFEHSFSERTGIDVMVGGNTLDRDGGYSKSGFFANATMTHAASERLNVKGYVRYGLDDYFLVVPTDTVGNNLTFQSRNSLRLGLSANYKVSNNISVYGGVSLVNSTYYDEVNNGDDIDTLIYNLNAGLRYSLNDSLSAVLNYNYTNSISDDASPYEYDRNRYSAGLEYKF